MLQSIRTVRATLAVGSVFVLAACGDKAADSRDLSMPASTSTATPALNDRASAPRTSAPVRSAPAAPAVASPSTTMTLAAGTAIPLRSTVQVCTDRNKVGDIVNATVASNVNGTNGHAVTAGTPVQLEVTQVSNEPMLLVLRPRVLTWNGANYTITGSSTQVMDETSAQTKTAAATKTGIGAAVGAIAGELIAKKPLIGAGIGAVAGGVVAKATEGKMLCLREGGTINVTLGSSVALK